VLVKNITSQEIAQASREEWPLKVLATTGGFLVAETSGWRGMFRTMGLGLRDLRVWQEAVGLGAEVIRALRQTNRREIKAVTEHTMVTALLMAEHVAEGYGRYAPGEQRQLYRAAKRELLRLETSLAIARQADLVSAAHHAQLAARIQTVSRLLSGFLVYLDRQIGADRTEKLGS
jgi:four helix bundle protein